MNKAALNVGVLGAGASNPSVLGWASQALVLTATAAGYVLKYASVEQTVALQVAAAGFRKVFAEVSRSMVLSPTAAFFRHRLSGATEQALALLSGATSAGFVHVVRGSAEQLLRVSASFAYHVAVVLRGVTSSTLALGSSSAGHLAHYGSADQPMVLAYSIQAGQFPTESAPLERTFYVVGDSRTFYVTR